MLNMVVPGEKVVGAYAESLARIKDIQCSPFIHKSGHIIMKGNQVGQA